jgi:aryl-alcohol dehydrogenase-like predicted oxidoreductase
MTAMPETMTSRRPLGRSGLEVSPLGIGAWAMGGADWASGLGAQDDRDSIAAIRRAVELGVNWIDTAAVYGLGHAEEVVGRAVREIADADRPFVFTKGGLVWDEDDHMADPRRSIAPDSLRRECEESLRRLQVDCIDLYQLHWPDDFGVPVEDSWQTMLDLRREGKVRAIGVSNFDVALLERCEVLGHVDCEQPPFSLIDRAAAAEVIPWCEANGTGVIVYSPMQSGLLSGRFTRERAESLPGNDFRTQIPWFSEPELSRGLALQDALRPIAERHGVSVAAIAIAAVAAWPGVTGAIAGARSADQVDGWVAAGTLALTDDDVTDIRAALASTRAGTGPTYPDSKRGAGGARDA